MLLYITRIIFPLHIRHLYIYLSLYFFCLLFFLSARLTNNNFFSFSHTKQQHLPTVIIPAHTSNQQPFTPTYAYTYTYTNTTKTMENTHTHHPQNNNDAK